MKAPKIILLPLSLLSLLLFGCTSEVPKAEDPGRMAFGSTQVAQDGPLIEVYSGILPQSRGRGPASTSPEIPLFKKRDPKGQEKLRNTSLIGHSNKRIYFLTLYSQFESFKKILDRKLPEISICPSFHSFMISNKREILETAENYGPIKGFKNYTQSSSAGLWPELYLPLTNMGGHPNVMDQLAAGKDQESVEKALGQALLVHVEKLYAEISELCEHGQSSNYYVFENLITHLKDRGEFNRSPEAIRALLKTTVFSNMAILQSLSEQTVRPNGQSSGRMPASLTSGKKRPSFGPLELETMKRLDVYWMKDYFELILKKRKSAAQEARATKKTMPKVGTL